MRLLSRPSGAKTQKQSTLSEHHKGDGHRASVEAKYKDIRRQQDAEIHRQLGGCKFTLQLIVMPLKQQHDGGF